MSVKRLIVSIDPGSLNVTEFCASHGISRWYFYDLRRRYLLEGDSCLELKSRAPKRVQNKTPIQIEDRIVELRKALDDQGLDAGPGSIRDRLVLEPGAVAVPSESTIWRILSRRGFITPEPKKRPRPAPLRFERTRANELWQIDGTLRSLANGSTVKVINIIDDASRVAVSSQAHDEETYVAAWQTVCSGGETWGLPEELISDNGTGLVALKDSLAAIGVKKTESRPRHPQTCGKVERFHQTMHKWLDAQPPSHDLDQLQTLLDTFTAIYNTQRPHRAIGRSTPADRFETLPKSGPATQPLTTQSRVHCCVADQQGRVTAGKRIRIALGTQHANQPAVTIINNHIAHTFINGQHVRQTQLNPNQNRYPHKPGKL